MNALRHLSLALLALLALASCRKDNPLPVRYPYESGIFVTNEGPFQNGTGTITWYHPDSAQARQQIFQQANGGTPLGNIVQSLTFGDSLGYIVVNNASKVVVVRAHTFEQVGVIENAALPRYLLVDGARGYLSQWGPDGLSGSVAVVDLSTRQITDTIATGSGAERMLRLGEQLYVANAGGFGKDSTLAVIDLGTRQLSHHIEVGPNPNSLVQDRNGDLWVLCGGDWASGAAGRLVQLSNGNVVQQFEVPTGSGHLVIDGAGSTLYFIRGFGGPVWRHPIDASALEAEAFIDGAWYSLGFDASREWLLAADAGDFTNNGTVYLYTTAGTLVDSFEAGIIPGNFALRQ